MRVSSELMKKAHQMTKEIKAEYQDVNYQVQLGLCISYLLQNEEELEMVELTGTEKQIKWADDIRHKILDMVKDGVENEPAEGKRAEKVKNLVEELNNESDSKFWIENFKSISKDNKCFFDFFNTKGRAGHIILKGWNKANNPYYRD